MRFIVFIIIVLSPVLSFSQNGPAKLQLPSLISDNMLLQQKANVKLWGKAASGQIVSVSASWNAQNKATTDKDGHWQLTLLTPAAGGPYTITIADKETSVTIKNVLIGEVWFCSGQSNMEMPMSGFLPTDTIEHAKLEIASANNQEIRLFNVQRAVSNMTNDDCVGKWEVCSPASVQSFSATAYFFGKKLYEKLHIPVGLIESAWGGTPIESWISGTSLGSMDDFKATISKMKGDLPKQSDLTMWLEKHKTVEVELAPENEKWKNLNFQDDIYAKQDFDDEGWPTMKIPQRWEDTDIGEFDGIMWYRKSIEIPVQMAGKELTLSLGPIDDMDRTYFNGVLVGAGEESGLWQVERNYTIPANLVKAGKNIIVVRVLDTQGGGGMWGKPEKMKLTCKNDITIKSIPLAGDWKYIPFAELVGNKFYVYNEQEFFSKSRPKPITAYIPTALYNGMVNPVISYQIKGAIWYQGEANVGRADQYAKLLPLMIQDWRRSWNVGPFPFYYVQIAPYEYSDKDSTSSAALREAQAKAMQVVNTGMAVTLDIGKVSNIHPPYKLEVGERLALWALAKDYNVQVPYSGPVYKSMIKEGNSIKLQFDFAQGGLLAKNGILKEFEIAGKDGKYLPAQSKIVNNEVVVSSSSVPEPVSVRYCWRNGAEASLFNGIGLPASVFRTK